jgi:membrane-associated protease RseP (regulator of RpoE activity)
MLLPVLLAILGFSFVIIIHELGHFLFAKWAGVKVLRFSVGFPPIIWQKQVGETSYAIGLIWAGGYVSMLGEEHAEGASDPRSLPNARPGWRALILLGGVLFNLVSSWLLLAALAWYGMPVTPPVVGGISSAMRDVDDPGAYVPSPAARLGLQFGDEIRQVNGVRTRSFEDVVQGVARAGGSPLRLEVRRGGETLHLGLDQEVKPVFDADRGLPMLGVEPPAGLRLEQLLDAGLQGHPQLGDPGWVLAAIDGKDVAGRMGQEVMGDLEPRVGEQVAFTFRRGAETRAVTVRYAGANTAPWYGAIGFPVRIKEPPVPGMPAAEAGLAAGDLITAVDGVPVLSCAQLTARVQLGARAGQPVRLERWRAGQREEVTLTAKPFMDGRLRLGLLLGEMVEGTLPVLPLQADGSSPLRAAGIAAGDTLLTLVPHVLDATHREVSWWVLRGGTPTAVALAQRPAPADFARLEGDLLGRRLVSATPSTLRLAGPDGSERDVASARLSSALQGALARLEPGDWIVHAGPAGDGFALDTVRGARACDKVALTVGDGGYALFLQTETRPYRLEYRSEPFDIATHAAVQMVVTTLSIIPKFFVAPRQGGIDATKTLSGPVGIFEMMRKQFARDGFAAWLRIVALIGLNLFLVNLLPIPMVDGGQLVQLAVEVALGRPLPDRIKAAINGIGLTLLISLMLFVLTLDILRKAGFM